MDERALHAAIVEALFSSRTPGVLSDPPLENHIRTALEQQMGEDFNLQKAEQTLEAKVRRLRKEYNLEKLAG